MVLEKLTALQFSGFKLTYLPIHDTFKRTRDSKKHKNKQNCDKENLIKIIANVKTKERDSSQNRLLLQIHLFDLL